MESSKLEWLENRKGMETPRNQYWLDYMRERGLAHQNTDKLLPWLHREYNKGRLVPGDYGDGNGPAFEPGLHYSEHENGMVPDGYTVLRDASDRPQSVTQPAYGRKLTLPDLTKLQDDLTEMQKRGQGVDLMQHNVPEVMHKVDDFRKWKGLQKRKEYGEVLHKFDNGWTVRRLQNDREHRDEGDLMHHCVGQPQYGYSENTENGHKIYASLRDEMNNPHATMEITPNHWLDKITGEETMRHPGYGPDHGWIPQIGPESEIEQFFGPNDSDPKSEHYDMMNEWLAAHDAPDPETGQREADAIRVPGPTDTEEYMRAYGEDGQYMEDYPEDEEGRPYGENTEWIHEIPNFHSVASDMLNPDTLRYRDAQPISNIFETARNNHHIQQFDEALQEEREHGNPEHDQVVSEWERLKQPYYHPYTGELQEGWGNPPVEEFQNRLFNDRTDRERQIPPAESPPSDSPYWNNYQVYGPEVSSIIPWQQNPNLARFMASGTKPLYVRWVYSPSKGVTIGSNADDHPAFVKYHQQLGGDINDTDLVHGYAYPIGNGWRVTDYEHQPLEDPYIVNQVVRGLNLGGSPQMGAEDSREASWRPVSYDFDRLHYGIPKAA